MLSGKNIQTLANIIISVFLQMRDNCLNSRDSGHLIKMRDCPVPDTGLFTAI